MAVDSANRQIDEARREADQVKRDADFKLALERCGAAPSEATERCVNEVRARFGRS